MFLFAFFVVLFEDVCLCPNGPVGARLFVDTLGVAFGNQVLFIMLVVAFEMHGAVD